MKIVPSLALISALAGVVLFGLMGMNLLSGPFEGRTCQTDCVFLYFISSFIFTALALAMGLFAWFSQSAKFLGIISVLIALGLMSVFWGAVRDRKLYLGK